MPAGPPRATDPNRDSGPENRMRKTPVEGTAPVHEPQSTGYRPKNQVKGPRGSTDPGAVGSRRSSELVLPSELDPGLGRGTVPGVGPDCGGGGHHGGQALP